LADARRAGRDDGLGAALGNQLADGVAVVAAVGDEPAERPEGGQQRRCGRRIGSITGGQQDQSRPAGLVGGGVQLAGPAASRGAEGLLERPPFPPAAERCALMCVLSIAANP
jgi:hypothetical protein